MKDRNILIVKLLLSDQIFKLASIIIAKDRSIYIAFPSKGIKASIDEGINHIKFSYHPTGKTHMKMAHRKNPITMTFRDNITFDNVTGITPTYFNLSFWDINTINSKKLLLDSTKNKSTYENTITIKASDYKHITISFFLKQKRFKIASDIETEYKEIHSIEIDDIGLIIGIKDEWAGKVQ